MSGGIPLRIVDPTQTSGAIGVRLAGAGTSGGIPARLAGAGESGGLPAYYSTNSGALLVVLDDSNAQVPSVTSETYAADFSGPAGTLLTSLPGWSLSRQGTVTAGVPKLDGSGNVVFNGSVGPENEGLWAALYTPVGDGLSSKATFTLNQSTGNYSQIRFWVGATDYANGFGLTFEVNTDGASFRDTYQRQAGVQTDLTAINPGGFVAARVDGTTDFIFDTSADGNSILVTVRGQTDLSATLDMTGKTHGKLIGVSGKSPYVSSVGDYIRIKSMSYIKALTTLSLTSEPLASKTNSAVYEFSWAGNKPTALQHRLYDPVTGLPTIGWVTGTSVVTGTTSGTITYTATSPSAGLFIPRFRMFNDTGIVVVGTGTQFVYAAYVDPQVGYGIASANLYQATPMLSNFAKYSEYSFGVWSLPPGLTGMATFSFDPGAGITWGTEYPANMTIVSQDATAGTLRANMITDGTTENRRALRVLSGSPTFLTVARDGQGVINSEWVAGFEGGECIRDLDMALVNLVRQNLPDRVRSVPTDGIFGNDAGVGPDTPYQFISQGVAALAAADANFKTYWSVLGPDVSDAYVTAKATYERDNIPQRIKIALEFVNEDWNTLFSSCHRQRLEAYRTGYYGAATPGSPLTPMNITGMGGGDPNKPAEMLTTIALTAGNFMMFDAYTGDSVWTVKADAPIGTTIPGPSTSYENTYFRRETSYDPIADGRKWKSWRFNQIIEIYRTVFGETRFQAQIMPLLMGQHGGTITTQLTVDRTWYPAYWDKIKGIGVSFYFSHENSYDRASATAANLEASFRAAMPGTKTVIRQLVSDAISLGKVPCFYEGFTHPDTNAYSNTAAYTNAWDTMFSSDLGRFFMRDMAQFMKKTVPGIFVGYDLTGRKPWSLKKSFTDTTSKRVVGWKEGLAL